jgi:hypothetical protein
MHAWAGPLLVGLMTPLGVVAAASHSAPGPVAEDRAALHRACVKAGERAEAEAAAMIPGRTWTWRPRFERSRRDLTRLRGALAALRDQEARFDATLDPVQRATVESLLESMQALWHHLEADAASLDGELRKGYPTRWHVGRDSSDMAAELRRWKTLHQQVATAVGVNR